MSRIIRLGFLALLVALFSPQAALRSQSVLDERFRSLEQEWMDALVAKDTVRLQQLLAAEFTIIGAGSSADDRPADRVVWLANAMRFDWPKHTVRLLGVRPLGAVTVVQAVLTATFPPRSITPEGGLVTFLVKDTWIERDGRWQVISRHASLAATRR